MKILRRKAVCEKLGGINDVTLWRITRDDSSCSSIRMVSWVQAIQQLLKSAAWNRCASN